METEMRISQSFLIFLHYCVEIGQNHPPVKAAVVYRENLNEDSKQMFTQSVCQTTPALGKQFDLFTVCTFERKDLVLIH